MWSEVFPEAGTRSRSVEMVLWGISQNLQESTCLGVSFLIKRFLRTPFLQNISGGCFCFFSLFLLIVAKRHFLQELDLFSISGLHQYFNCNMFSVLGLSFCFKFSLLRFYIYFTVWVKMVISGKIFGFWTGWNGHIWHFLNNFPHSKLF